MASGLMVRRLKGLRGWLNRTCICGPDLNTFTIIPWLDGEEATARLICDVFTPDGQPFQGDPRAVLRRAIAEAEEMGFVYNTGPELEFFLLKPHAEGMLIPLQPHDTGSYFDAPSDKAAGLRRQMATPWTR